MVETNVQKPAGAEGMYNALPNFGALPGFAEAALAFKHTGAQTDIPETVLQLIADKAELDAARDVAKGTLSKLEKLKDDLGGSPEIDRLISELQLALASGNLRSIRELNNVAENVMQNLDAARSNGDAPESPQQKMARLWNELGEIDKRSEDFWADKSLTVLEREALEEKRRAYDAAKAAYAENPTAQNLAAMNAAGAALSQTETNIANTMINDGRLTSEQGDKIVKIARDRDDIYNELNKVRAGLDQKEILHDAIESKEPARKSNTDILNMSRIELPANSMGLDAAYEARLAALSASLAIDNINASAPIEDIRAEQTGQLAPSTVQTEGMPNKSSILSV